MNVYDPILKARQVALARLDGELSIDDYEVAQKAVDEMIDAFEAIMTSHTGEITWHDETGSLRIIGDNDSSGV